MHEIAEPYSALSAVYDAVMDHVDYESWATYTGDLIHRYFPNPQSILEIGCGTGSRAVLLCKEFECRFAASDISLSMLEIARKKAAAASADIDFFQADFRELDLDTPFDVVVCLHDSFNYLLSDQDVERLFGSVWNSVVPGGIFIFDQSTPANSINNEETFDDEGSIGDNQYIRTSRYLRWKQRHITEFDLLIDGRRFLERHVQRAWRFAEVRRLIKRTDFQIVASFDGLTTHAASGDSERVHWVLTKPEYQSA